MKTNRVNGRTARASSRVCAGQEAGGERCGFKVVKQLLFTEGIILSTHKAAAASEAAASEAAASICSQE
jgi:hypothetical protein